jgi:tRNA modification GTPase
MESDTVAAVATAPGMGALAVVRMSGRRALAIADAVFQGKVAPSSARDRSILSGEVVGRDGSALDQVLVLVMRGPASATGEDVVEITCHGGLLVPRMVLRRLVEEGARPAEPGEFTRRAFLNGKIDLAQAEAVEEIVRASSERALRAAMGQLKGGLSREIGSLEDDILRQLVLVEADLEFPEEEVDRIDSARLGAELRLCRQRLEALVASQERGKYLRQGLTVAIVGKPNVGKSSLFNRLVGKDRVIVSDVPGTTRDVVDALVGVDGVVLRIQDTAGLRRGTDSLEKEAVRRTGEAVAEADLAVVVWEAGRAPTDEDLEILEEVAGKPRVVVVNKVDLAPAQTADVEISAGERALKVSALKGWGVADLLAELAAAARERVGDADYQIIANERHAASLTKALEALGRGGRAVADGLPPELVASDLRWALDCLGEVTGRKATSGILDAIFSRFCIGK